MPDNPNLPMGGHSGYGPSSREFTLLEQRRAIEANYFAGGGLPLLYECGCCGSYHPQGFLGDCRQDIYRVDEPDDLWGDEWAPVEGNDSSDS